MTLLVQYPDTRRAEHEYAFHVILGEFLGIDYVAAPNGGRDIVIAMRGDDARRTLTIADRFLTTDEGAWLTETSLPQLPLPECALGELPFPLMVTEQTLPVLFGKRVEERWWTVSPQHTRVGIDLFGGAFFMLTRYEEIVIPTRDEHDRFPAKASMAYRGGFLHRPIVNEYAELLWAFLTHLWPGLTRRRRETQVVLSHDVDWPLVTLGVPLRQTLRSAIGDVRVRKDPGLAARRLLSWRNVRRGRFDGDVGNCFDFILETSERYGLRSAFNVITDHTAGSRDGTYDIGDPWMRNLLRRIHERGHEIGLHPSYGTYRDAGQTRREFERLLRVCDEEGIRQDAWGGRQHYLRWTNPDTWQNWDDAGLTYDSTLSFADHVGFRAGTCYEYPVFNLLTRRQLGLVERPLIVMEATLFATTSPTYMALPDRDACAMIDDIRARVEVYRGQMTLLWHNSSMISARQRSLYADVVGRLAGA